MRSNYSKFREVDFPQFSVPVCEVLWEVCGWSRSVAAGSGKLPRGSTLFTHLQPAMTKHLIEQPGEAGSMSGTH